jgi:hypothetical protein
MSVAEGRSVQPFDPTEDLSPSAVEAFLRLSGWRRDEYRKGISSIWSLDEADASILVPHNRTYRDFSARLRDALYTIADVYNLRSEEALALEIAGARSDILLLRTDQQILDGSIPLSEAQDLLGGVSKMLLAAACSAIKPSSSIPRRRPDVAREFMAEEVRMGHTLRGSFVITILARHDEERMEELPEPDESERHPQTVPRPAQPPMSSYTRRVMTTLSSGLQAARDLLREDSTLSLEDAVQLGATAELIESLGNISRHPGVRGIEMSFKWSPAQPTPPGAISSRVFLPRPQPDRIDAVRESLRRRPVVEQNNVFGQVVRLERAEGQDEGVVVVDGYLGRTRRRIKMNLAGDAYRLAIRAHEERRPIVALGEVALERRSWWLKGPVTIDILNP